MSGSVPFLGAETGCLFMPPTSPMRNQDGYSGTELLFWFPGRGFEEGGDGEGLLSGIVCPCTQVNWFGSPTRGLVPNATSRKEFLAEVVQAVQITGVLHCAARWRAALFRMTKREKA